MQKGIRRDMLNNIEHRITELENNVIRAEEHILNNICLPCTAVYVTTVSLYKSAFRPSSIIPFPVTFIKVPSDTILFMLFLVNLYKIALLS